MLNPMSHAWEPVVLSMMADSCHLIDSSDQLQTVTCTTIDVYMINELQIACCQIRPKGYACFMKDVYECQCTEGRGSESMHGTGLISSPISVKPLSLMYCLLEHV